MYVVAIQDPAAVLAADYEIVSVPPIGADARREFTNQNHVAQALVGELLIFEVVPGKRDTSRILGQFRRSRSKDAWARTGKNRTKQESPHGGHLDGSR